MNRTLSQHDVARSLDVSVSTLRRWVQRGYFPTPAYIGRRAVYDRATVNNWIARKLEN